MRQRAAGTAWSPYKFAPSILRAWWCADDHATDLMTDDGAGLISSWKGRANGLAVTAAAALRPTWSATGWKGGTKPALVFNAANNMVMAALDAVIPSAAVTSTLVVVADAGVIGTTRCALSYGANGAATRRQLQRTAAGGMQANDQSSNYVVTDTPPWETTAIGIAQFEASKLTLWKNGALVGTDDGTLNTTPTKLVIGGNAATTPAALWLGTIRHVMVFSGVLPTADRQQLERWLSADSLISLAA